MTPEEEELLQAQLAETEEQEFEAENAAIEERNQRNQALGETKSPDAPYVPPTNEQGENTSGPTSPEEQAKAQIPNPIQALSDVRKGDDNNIPVQVSKAVLNPQQAIQEHLIARPMRDFAMDAVGKIPGLGWLDDEYDKQTRFNNPALQKMREALSIIVPSALGGIAATKATGGVAAPAVVKGLGALALTAGTDVAITALSDQSERDETMLTELDKAFPDLNIPKSLVTLEGDSPKVRREKNMLEAAGLSIIGDVLGFGVSLGKPVLGWFKPLNRQADNYLASQKSTLLDADTAEEVSKLDEILTSDLLDQKGKDRILKQKNELIQQAEQTGTSSATKAPIESTVSRNADSRQMQIDEDGLRALEADPASIDYNPNITSSIAGESTVARQSIPPANVARNMADVAAIKSGKVIGDPAPIITTPMMKKGLQLDSTSRAVVQEIAEESRAIGKFSAVVDGFRFTKEEMGSAAWKIYGDIVNAGSVQDMRQLFLSNRDVKNIVGGEISYINETQATAVGFAMRDLINTYIGREVTETSARVMDTLGREIGSISKAATDFAEVADPKQMKELILGKLNFLMDEYATNKYIAGWTLQNKKWWKNLGSNADETLQMMKGEFDSAIDVKRKSNAKLIDALDKAMDQDPQLATVMVDAYNLTNGDVDTIAKLTQWGADQLNPMGMVYSGSGGMNSFASGLWAIRYNNMLSGLSAFRAGLGTTTGLMLKPINHMIGLGIESLISGDFNQVKSGMYAYGSFIETNKRALSHAWGIWKKANVDPDSVIDITRSDFVQQQKYVRDTLDGLAETWDWDKDFGKKFLHKWDKANHTLSKWAPMRWGTNAMVAVDAFASSTLATHASRFDAYDQVFRSQSISPKAMNAAELKNYKNYFNEQGKISDKALKTATGEIALNLDSPLASVVSSATGQVPLLKSLFTFPKTGIESFRLGATYTPLALIPGVSRSADILLAGEDITKIRKAMAAHGYDYDSLPNGYAAYKNLRAEYGGRLVFSGMVVTGLFGFAMAGNIRSNGDPENSERKKMRDNLGYKQKTIKIGGKWVDYSAFGEPVDSVLTLMGDMAYYMRDISSPVMEDIQTKLAWTFAATFTNKTFVSQLEPFVALATGDEEGWTRFAANEVRSTIPMSGALGVLAQAISNSRKDIYKDMRAYLANRLPGANTELPEQRDIYTGDPIDEIDNHFLRALNALSPIKINAGTEPWRQTLIDIGYDGPAMITKDSTGKAEYPANMRDQLYAMIGSPSLVKRIEKELGEPSYQDDIREIRAARVAGVSSDEIRNKDYPLYKRLDTIMRETQQVAEQQLMQVNPKFKDYINLSSGIKAMTSQGRTDEARVMLEERRKLEIENLRKFGNQ